MQTSSSVSSLAPDGTAVVLWRHTDDQYQQLLAKHTVLLMEVESMIISYARTFAGEHFIAVLLPPMFEVSCLFVFFGPFGASPTTLTAFVVFLRYAP